MEIIISSHENNFTISQIRQLGDRHPTFVCAKTIQVDYRFLYELLVKWTNADKGYVELDGFLLKSYMYKK